MYLYIVTHLICVVSEKNNLYKHEMTYKEHIELLEVLKNHPGKVLLSGYDNELYNNILEGWKKVQTDTLAEGGLKRTETLWMNYAGGVEETAQMNIFDLI